MIITIIRSAQNRRKKTSPLKTLTGLAVSTRVERNMIKKSLANMEILKLERQVRETLFIGSSGKAANFQSTFQVLKGSVYKLINLVPVR